jgi:hypothetical protein
VNQQSADETVAALVDAKQAGLAAAGMLAWRQAKERGHLAAILELPCGADAAHRRSGRQRSDAGDVE